MAATVDYKISITTGNVNGAGTDANVYVELFGDNGSTGELKIPAKKEHLERGRTDIYTLTAKDVGSLTKLRVGHDGKGLGAGWYLDKIVVTNLSTGVESHFTCERWLDKGQDDGQIVRELVASESKHKTSLSAYRITITTGDVAGSGTGSNVYIALYGDRGTTGVRFLNNNKSNFKQGRTDVFYIEAEDIGPITKVKIGHDNSAWFSKGWYLERVVIKTEKRGEYLFTCKKWLDSKKEDGKIERELNASEGGKDDILETLYTVTVKTGDVRGAGTKAGVFITLFGDKTDSGQRELDNSPGNFERGRTDTFSIATAELGELKKIRIGHDNRGVGADWFLESVVVKNERSGKEWRFNCNKWFSKDIDDAQLVRDLVSGDSVGGYQAVTYTVTVRTGNIRGAGTDSNVFLNIIGDQGDSGKRSLDNSANNFEKGRVDIFGIDSIELGEIQKIEIGHDGKGFGAGWFLQDVTIKNDKTGKEWKFPCGRWLAADEDDGKIVRELLPSAASVSGGASYKITVYTGTRRGAGTDANVFIELYGERGRSGVKQLNNSQNNFEKGKVDNFSIEGADLGALQKIRIGHDGKGFGAGWFLDKVVIHSSTTDKDYYFLCGKWLASDEDDKQIVRELPASGDGIASPPLYPYQIDVITGDRRGAGTDANVHITIYGDKGDSGSRKLEGSGNLFERKNTDTFGFEMVDLGELKKIRIGHDNGGFGPAWFLDKVIVTNKSTNRSWYFLCGRWLAKNEDDGQIEREIGASPDGIASPPLTTYKITVITGDRRGAGTDANVHITLFGENGDSGRRKLENSAKNLFERGQRDEFGFECVEMGPIKRIIVGHDGKGFGAGWFLDKVIVKSETLGKEYYFLCGRWLDTDQDDGKIERELEASDSDGTSSPPLVGYKVAVTTADRRGAGTDANVFITLYGKNGNSGEVKLSSSKNNFERGATDIFGFESEDLGELTKLRIGHDNSGFRAGWFLDKVVITNLKTNHNTYFLCGKWLDKHQDDKQIVRELPASNEDGTTIAPLSSYKIFVTTGDRRGAGTDANVYITVYGSQGDSGSRKLEGAGNLFERGKTDEFGFESVDLGDLTKIRIGHDNAGFLASWFLEKVIITEEKSGKNWYFLSGRWFSKREEDGQIEREIPAQLSDGIASVPLSAYKITVITGDRRGAGTDANIHIILWGDKGDSGKRKLEKPGRNLFERAARDEFGFEAVELGEIKKITIGHDGVGFGAGWFLDKIVVKSESLGKEWYFLCGRWLDKNQDDGKIERELFAQAQDGIAVPPLVGYRVATTTANRRGAGTDANVFIVVYGKNGDSGEVKLTGKGRNLFERGATDLFGFESQDLGELTKVRIGHDGKGFGAGWFLDKVTITNLKTNTSHYFMCGRWLAVDEDDGQIVRELPANSQDGGSAVVPLVKYKIKVTTGTVRGAGTDADVFIILYGENGDTGKRALDSPKNNFERGQVDEFVVEAIDLGKINKIRVGHNGKGFGAGWFLDNIIVKLDQENGSEYKFPCNRWFAVEEDDGKIERDLLVDGPSGPGAASYRITVITGSIKGAGTDASVFITIVGDKGKVDRERLENARDNFQRGKIDSFGVKTLDMGQIKQITIGHDGRGFGSGWFLDKVFITHEETKERWVFPCNRWLDKGEDDGKIERTLLPGDGSSTTFQVKVKTGKVKGAGTDANVFLQVFGEKGNTDRIPLSFSLTNTNKFESGCLDIFNVDSKDVGNVQKVRIGHDNSGLGASWFLDSVELIDLGAVENYFFPCNRWFDKKKEDNLIERELTPAQKVGDIVQEEGEEETETSSDNRSETSSDNRSETPKVSPRISLEGKILSVNILAGRNLASKDSNGFSDPYVVLHLLDSKGNQDKKSKQKSSIKDKTLNPQWDNEILRLNTSSDTSGLEVSVWDQDKVGSDEFMGQFVIPASDFALGSEKWYPLQPREGKKDEVSGDLSISFNLLKTK